MSLVALRTIALSATFAVLVAACVEEGHEPFASLDEPVLRSGEGGMAVPATDDPGGGVWVNNGLHDPDVSGIDPDYSLASPQGLAPDHGLLLDPDRRNVVRYLVECALPEGHGITKQVGGELLEFDGAIGLAPEWEDDACDEDCQEWVSACLLARTNVSEQTVYIWMRGDHPAIGEGTSLSYPSYEASFFGNLFADSASQHFCKGTVVGPLLGQLRGRTCAALVGQPCGFVEYELCELQQRCMFSVSGLLGLGIGDSPKNCIAGPLPGGPAFHTISTYVGVL
jgi:hypothetical protein